MNSRDIAMANGGQTGYRYVLAFSLALGCFLRFHQIGGQPLWLDEAFSHWFSGRTIAELWTVVPRFETNPPLYYTILKLWKSVFGSSEACLRSLSAVMSIGCIPLVYLIGRLLGKSIGGEWIGAMAALLFAVAPVQIQYAQEARQYAMLTFGTTLTLCAVLWIMRHPAEACEPLFGSSSGRKPCPAAGSGWPVMLAWATVIVAVPFTLWLHNTAVLYIFTLFLIMLAWFSLQLRLNRTFLVNMTTTGAVAFLLWAPYLVFLIPQTRSASLPIPAPTVPSVVNTVVLLLLGHSISWTASVNDLVKMTAFALLIILAAAGLLNIRRRSGPYIALLLLGSTVGPILMALLFSVLFRPIFLARTLIYVSVPFFLAIAAGIMMVPGPRKRALIMVLFSLLFLKWNYTYYGNHEKAGKEPWDRVAQTVARDAREDVVLLVPNNIEIPFSYYADRMTGGSLHIVPMPFPLSDFLHPALDPERLGSDSLKAIQIRTSDIPAIDGAIARRSPVWLVTRREDLFDQHALVFNALAQKRGLVSTQQFGEISVYQFR
ncbi:MAG TPA: glycosyltransferase family 39 protein [Nitrospirota bacterium]|nr:glycosyltransferase family 39 protein [Nitrospirota bacterium]